MRFREWWYELPPGRRANVGAAILCGAVVVVVLVVALRNSASRLDVELGAQPALTTSTTVRRALGPTTTPAQPRIDITTTTTSIPEAGGAGPAGDSPVIAARLGARPSGAFTQPNAPAQTSGGNPSNQGGTEPTPNTPPAPPPESPFPPFEQPPDTTPTTEPPPTTTPTTESPPPTTTPTTVDVPTPTPSIPDFPPPSFPQPSIPDIPSVPRSR